MAYLLSTDKDSYDIDTVAGAIRYFYQEKQLSIADTACLGTLHDEIKQLQAENARLREGLEKIVNYVCENMIAIAKQALHGDSDG